MAFHIGEVYRYSNQNRNGNKTKQFVDGLPNFFYETACEDAESDIVFQKGIHNIKAITCK